MLLIVIHLIYSNQFCYSVIDTINEMRGPDNDRSREQYNYHVRVVTLTEICVTPLICEI